MACICRALARQKDRREEEQKEGRDRGKKKGRKEKEEKVGHISFFLSQERFMLGTPPASWTWGVSHTLTCKQVITEEPPRIARLFCCSRSEVVPMPNTPIKQYFCS